MKKTVRPIPIIIIVSMLLLSCNAVSAISNQVSQQLSGTVTALQQTIVPPSQAPVATLAPGATTQSLSQTALTTPVALPTQAVAQPPAAAVNPETVNAYEGALEAIYKQVSPSVVNINVVLQTSGFNAQGGNGALGTGFIWDTQGHIVTNNHVIDGATSIEVNFPDGSIYTAKVVGTDPYSDLAVIKVDNVPAELLKPVTMGDSSKVQVGQIAIAIGTPYGLQGSMTVGIISAIGRQLPVDQGSSTAGAYQIPDIIQTDAAINPGNSGGVLVDDQGQVIGVTFEIQSGTGSNAGIGFVIPSAIVTKVVPSLISTGTFQHSWLGISGLSLTPDLAQAMNLSPQQRGALIETVTAGGPSDKAGLRASNNTVTISGQDVQVGGDVIIGIDQQPVKAMDDVIAYLASNTTAGQKVTLTILRNGVQQNVDVTLGVRPASTSNQQPSLINPNPVQPLPTVPPTTGGAYLGIVPVTMTPDIAAAMNLQSNQTGALVTDVSPGTPAAKAGLVAGTTPFDLNGTQINVGGDIITGIDGQQVTTADDLRAFLSTANPGQTITLNILRGGSTQNLKVTLGSRQ